jgi:hypothetical protein
MLKNINTQYSLTLLQMLLVLATMGGGLWFYQQPVFEFFNHTQAGLLGLILNGVVVAIFLIGLLRMVLMFISYSREQSVLRRFVKRAQENAASPTYALADSALIVERYNAVQTITRQHGEVNQAALAATLVAGQMSQFTLIRYVNSILILAGVLGTVISLAVALMGAAGLMNSPENMKNMWNIIGGMSNSLSTTVTSIVCYVFFAYFYLCLQDARTQLLANIEDATSLYIMPRFQQTEGNNLMQDVAKLVSELRTAAETVNQVQNRFLQAGERLQLAVGDLQTVMAQSGDNIRVIRESVREGFRLDAKDKT